MLLPPEWHRGGHPTRTRQMSFDQPSPTTINEMDAGSFVPDTNSALRAADTSRSS
jgi:hypothetical protein